MDTIDPRFVDLRGAFNFRDLGGLPTADGRHTRRGVMFRSDALHHLEPSDVDRLLELGVMSIVDLRSITEVEMTGRGLLAEESIGWFHMPLSNLGAPGYTPPPALAEGDMGTHYVESLAGRTEQLARVIRHLANPESLPAVFHCTAGKDRTGMVAALVLEIVGVGPQAIVDDYALTDAMMPRIVERFGEHHDSQGTWVPVAEGVFRAEAKSMQTFLAAVDDGYGGATGWARSAGLEKTTLARLRELLVDAG
jgi:protein tyrosine/serine phosphatase